MSFFKPPIVRRIRRSVSSDSIRKEREFFEGKSLSPSGDFTGLPPEGLNLDPEKELEIWSRLESGDWKPGAGWKQFLPQPTIRSRSRSPISRFSRLNISRFSRSRSQSIPNLSKAFAALEAEEARKADLSISPISPKVSMSTMSLEEELAQYNIVKEDLPEYQQQAINLMDEVDNYRITVFGILNALIEQEFSESSPLEKLAKVTDKMDEAMLALEKMASPKMTPFYTKILLKTGFELAKENSIPLKLQKHKECIESFAALRENLEAVNSFLESPNTLKIEDGIHRMEEMVKALEKDVERAFGNIPSLEYYRRIAFEIQREGEESESEKEN